MGYELDIVATRQAITKVLDTFLDEEKVILVEEIRIEIVK